MDTWSVLAPALLSLAGVGLGTMGSLVGQHLSSRTNVRRLDAEQWQAHRAELKQSIIAFLAAVRHVEQAARRVPPDGGENATMEPLVNELWLAQHELDLVAVSEPLRGAAYRYASSMAALARREPSEAEELRRAGVEFMDAARADLWPTVHRKYHSTRE